MQKKDTVKNNRYFNQIISEKNFLQNDYYTIYIKEKKIVSPQFGIAVSKKFGNAVVRNKLKRQLRSIIDQNRNLFANNYDYIIVLRKKCVAEQYQVLFDKLGNLLQKEKNEKK